MTTLEQISHRLKTQDNRITQNPMFCVQEEKRDVGYDSSYADNTCWYHADSGDTVYERPADETDYEEFGYKDRWETVMVAFTEAGCQEYIELNGHNHQGKLRIYAESFNRCPEMIFQRPCSVTPRKTILFYFWQH